jgi:hypothetical protein
MDTPNKTTTININLLAMKAAKLSTYFLKANIDEFVKNITDGARRKCPWGVK